MDFSSTVAGLSTTSLSISLAKFAALYLAVLGIYRLYLAPSAKFPGPRLAALTFWYEFYYDVWPLEGQYTWKIKELHEKYGPFVRINPYEVHCNDPEFFDVLYVSGAKRRTDKWWWPMRQTWTRNATFKTIEHDLHRQRRSQLSPFFSKASVRTLEPLVVAKVDQLCKRLDDAAGNTAPLSLTHAFVALTLDVISLVCFGFAYGVLELDNFAQEWYDEMVALSRSMHLWKQFPWLLRLPRSVGWLPRLLLGSQTTAAKGRDATKKRQRDLTRQVTGVINRHARGEKSSSGSSVTIFHAMLQADVPRAEKTVERLVEEAHTLTSAGSMTTANTLDTTFYHLLSNPQTHLSRLRRELDKAIPDSSIMPAVSDLEKLPFLTAVIHEALRLSKGVPHRLARVSPDESYRFGSVVIPRGVPVGMTSITLLEDTEMFPEPHKFRPERWMPFDAPETRRRRKALVVFGGGTRMCLGLNLAWAELYITVAMVIRRFGERIRLCDVVFERDVKIVCDGFNPLPSRESKGLRVMIFPDCSASSMPTVA